MNNTEMNAVQTLAEKAAKTELVGFESRFIIALSKHNAKYNLSLWEQATLKRISSNHGVDYSLTNTESPTLSIHYISNSSDMPKDVWGYELENEYDVGDIENTARVFADEVLMDKTKVPVECWVRRNEVFFSGVGG